MGNTPKRSIPASGKQGDVFYPNAIRRDPVAGRSSQPEADESEAFGEIGIADGAKPVLSSARLTTRTILSTLAILTSGSQGSSIKSLQSLSAFERCLRAYLS
jgi:hypothetical protein